MKNKLFILFLVLVALCCSGFTNQESNVVYSGNSHEFITAETNFMKNMNQMLPGDEMSGKVAITIKDSNKVELYFKTEQLLKSDEKTEHDALKDICLTILNGNEIIFKGTLQDSSEKLLLGTYQENDSIVLNYKVEIPTYVDNTFNMQDVSNRWIFYANEIPVKSATMTGDSVNLLGMSLITASTLMLTLVLKRKKN